MSDTWEESKWPVNEGKEKKREVGEIENNITKWKQGKGNTERESVSEREKEKEEWKREQASQGGEKWRKMSRMDLAADLDCKKEGMCPMKDHDSGS